MRTNHGHAGWDPLGAGEDAWVTLALDGLTQLERVERVTHGFHTYPAGLHPDAAGQYLAALPGSSVFDPFCGGGTVLVEGLLAGRRVSGSDLSSVACLVARTRTAVAGDAELTDLRSTARALAERARVARHLPEEEWLHDWYEPHVLAELEGIRNGLLAREDDGLATDLLWACFSSIVIKASFRKSDTSSQRVPTQRPPGTTAVLFHKKARELGRRLTALREAVPEGTPAAEIRLGDARSAAPSSPVDLVMTSPPYPTIYDYVAMQSLRETWLGVRSPASREIGSRRAFLDDDPDAAMLQWQIDTRSWMNTAAGALVPGGHLLVVIGDGRLGDHVVDAGQVTCDVGASLGLERRVHASVARPEHARGGVRREHVVLLRRR